MPSPFDRIFNDIRKDVPSVVNATFAQELFRVMDDFTQTTNIWRETFPLTIVPNDRSYTVAPTDGQPNRLLLVYNVDASTLYWAASGITMRVPGVIELFRNPTTAANWAAVIAKRVSNLTPDGYPVIDDWIVDKYADTIGRGVLARIQFEPQKPYSNPMLAQTNQRAYIAGRSLARANDGAMNVYNGQAWLYPQGFSTVNRKPWA